MCYVALVIVSKTNQTGTFPVIGSYIEKKAVALWNHVAKGESVNQCPSPCLNWKSLN
jgi:hypothetical protein